ncbi:hypothetical protein SARC_11022, partial [Sphaeroforma arctica JP610]
MSSINEEPPVSDREVGDERPPCRNSYCFITAEDHLREFYHKTVLLRRKCRGYMECDHVSAQWHTCKFLHTQKPPNADLLTERMLFTFPHPFEPEPEYECGLPPYTVKEQILLHLMQ